MEILSIEMMHNVWLLVEFIDIDVFDSKALFTSLLNMESIGDIEEVWVNESQ